MTGDDRAGGSAGLDRGVLRTGATLDLQRLLQSRFNERGRPASDGRTAMKTRLISGSGPTEVLESKLSGPLGLKSKSTGKF